MNLEKEILELKKRNQRVESDKSWETSTFRKLIIAILTYFTVVVFFSFAGIQKPFLNAIVPSLAFVISTLTLPFVKNYWLKYFYKN